jgi:putative spermidine/putrescine transport system permease protein
VLTHLSTFLYRRPKVALALLLLPPLLWLGVAYVGALAALLVQSLFGLDHFTGQVVRRLTLSTYGDLFTPANATSCCAPSRWRRASRSRAPSSRSRSRTTRCAFAGPRLKALIYLGVDAAAVVELSRARLRLEADPGSREGIVELVRERAGLGGVLESWPRELPVVGGPSLSTSHLGTFIVFVYVWLPFMILP